MSTFAELLTWVAEGHEERHLELQVSADRSYEDDEPVDEHWISIDATDSVYFGDHSEAFQGVSRVYTGAGSTLDEAAARVFEMINETKDKPL